jgi:hypothetical protein
MYNKILKILQFSNWLYKKRISFLTNNIKADMYTLKLLRKEYIEFKKEYNIKQYNIK